MICPHCGGEIVTYGESYTERVNTTGQPSINLLPNVNGCAAQPYPIITNVNGILWSNVCAGGALAQPITFHYTVGDNAHE